MNRRMRIYVDTSVIGGCVDEEFREPSLRLFSWFRRGDATLVVSDLTLLEIDGAPLAVRDILSDVPREHREDIMLTDEARALADEYVVSEVVPPRDRIDAQHIALATVTHCDVLASWNFKHIVNLTRIRGYNSVNLRLGYTLLEVRSPREIVGDETEKDL
jgi:hypothetical protein